MRWILAAAVAVCSVLVGHAAKVVDLFPQPFGILQWDKPPYTDEFRGLVSDGMGALKRDEIDRGIELLTRATKLRLTGVHAGDDAPPNFELWDDIALTECKRSERTKALSLLL